MSQVMPESSPASLPWMKGLIPMSGAWGCWIGRLPTLITRLSSTPAMQNTFATEAAFTIVDPAGMLGIAITGGPFDPANLAGSETWTPVGHFGVGKAERSFDSDYIF